METAENRASRNLAVLGKGIFVVILQRWEYRGTWVTHYNQGRPHLSLGPGVPERESSERFALGKNRDRGCQRLHHYVFTLYALDVPRLEVHGALTGANVLAALSTHVLASKVAMTIPGEA